MKLSPSLWRVAGLFAIAIAGLVAPGLAGQLGSYVWLGVFPGLAIVRLLLPRASTVNQWTVGLALSPLVSTLFAAALLAGGLPLTTSARLIGIAGWLLFAGGEARGHTADPNENAAPSQRWVWAASLAAGLFIAIPPLLNPWILVRSDGWVHGALVWEIAHHGVPPVDPRFIGMHLNYVWFYNLFIAQLTSLRGQDPFVFMAIMNVVDLILVVWLVWQLAWAVWGERRAAQGAVVLLLLGMNAGAYLLWPLRLLRALSGEVRGWPEVKRLVGAIRLDSTDVLYELNAPFAHMVQFLDKFTLGTPIGYAWLMFLLHFLALARWLESGNARWLAVGALAAAGMQLFHGVVGMSVVPVTLGAVLLVIVLARRFTWLPRWERLAAYAAATMAGFLACTPYSRAISKGWDAEASGVTHRFLHFTAVMPWTVLTACGVAILLTVPSVRRAVREQRGLAAWLTAWICGMIVFSLFVHLPESNEHKFVWPIFATLAVLGGAWLWPAMEALRRRAGSLGLALVFLALFLVPPALWLRGYVLDPGAHASEALTPSPGEPLLDAWFRDSTATDVVVIDHRSRDLVNVHGQRRLLAGTVFGSERAAFPAAELARRRALSEDLFGPVAEFTRDLAALDSIRTRARALHPVSDILVLYRPGDFGVGEPPWRRLEVAAGNRAELRYSRDGFRVYRLAP